MSDAARALWMSQPQIHAIVRFERATPSGRRFGNRLLGIGFDGVVAALMAVVRHPRSAFVANNPWIAVPLVLLGRDVWTTGIYAEANSRSWRFLRRAIGERPIVTTCEGEVTDWNADGGRAASVTYGTSFGRGLREDRDGPVRIFIGGTSDRDATMIQSLVAAVESVPDVELVVATGAQPAGRVRCLRVQYPGWVTQERFVDLIRNSDVVFLPLRAATRAAGHMVTVAALESGVPVVTTRSRGMAGYVDGFAVTEVDRDGDVLSTLVTAGRTGRLVGAEPYTERWRLFHAPAVTVPKVLSALEGLSVARA